MSQNLDNLTYLDVTLDSRFADAGSSDAPIFHTSYKNIVGGCVLSATIPYSFYVIDRLCNEFLMKPPQAPDYLPFSVWPGSYSMSELEGAMRECLADGAYSDNASWGAFHKMGRLVLYNTGASFDAPNPFHLQINNESLATILGFEPNVEYEANYDQLTRDGVFLNNGNPLQYIIAPFELQLSPAYLELRSNELSSRLKGSSVATNIDDNILLKIPVNTTFSSFITYQGTGVLIPLDSRTTLERPDFYLTIPGREDYSALSLYPDSPIFQTQSLPFYNQPFAITLRLWQDTGLKMS